MIILVDKIVDFYQFLKIQLQFIQEYMKKSKVVNIQESPFFDKSSDYRTHKHLNHPNKNFVLPTYHQQIQWKEISGKKKYEEKTFDIPAEQYRKIIGKIIKLYLKYQSFDPFFLDHEEIVNLLKENQQLITKLSKEKYPKAVAAEFLCSLVPSLSQQIQLPSIILRLEQVSNKTNYPLANVLLALNLMKKGQIDQKIQRLFDKAIQYGQSFAFQLYGFYCYTNKQYIKAYQMYKNAEKLKCIPLAYFRLGEILLTENDPNMSKNIIAAVKYFEFAKDSKLKPNKTIENKIKKLNDEIQDGEKKASKIISDIASQARSVANYIHNKYFEIDTFTQGGSGSGSTSNVMTGQGVCFTPRTFFVVFSPLMNFPSRMFLGEDEKGNIQSINIYNWNLIEPNRLALLHKLGTKVIIRQYIRKYGANDQLPIFRVENPYAVQIIENPERHCISDKKYRQFAKYLFSSGLYAQCLQIYNHLIKKQASQLEIIYCNMGLISEKSFDFNQAKKYYIKSLAIKYFQKAAYRLAKIYISQNNLEEAGKQSEKLTSQPQKKQIQTLIKQLKQKLNKQSKEMSKQQFQSLNFNKIKFAKKPNTKGNRKNIIQIVIQRIKHDKTGNLNLLTGYGAWYVCQGYYFLCSILEIDASLGQQPFIYQIQKIYNAGQLPLKRQNIGMFKKFFNFCYYFFNKRFKTKTYNQSFGYFYQLHRQLSLFMMKCFKENGLNAGYDKTFKKDQQVQIIASIALRCNYLQNRIQNHCLSLQKNEKFQQAKEFYQCAHYQCLPFCAKVAQMLNKQHKYAQNIKYCSAVLQKYQAFDQTQSFFSFVLTIENQMIKSFFLLKRFDEACKAGIKFLQQIKKRNPGITSAEFALEKIKNIQMAWNFGQVFPKQKTVQTAKMCQLKNNIANSFFMMKKYDQAISYINDNEVNKLMENQKELYFSTLLLKIKILKKLNHNANKIKEILVKSLKFAQNIEEKSGRNVYKAAILKQMLNISLEKQNMQSMFDEVTKIISINERFAEYVIRKLFQFGKTNQNLIIQLISGLNKNNLDYISEELREYLGIYYSKKLQSVITQGKYHSNDMNQQLLKYFDLVKTYKPQVTQLPENHIFIQKQHSSQNYLGSSKQQQSYPYEYIAEDELLTYEEDNYLELKNQLQFQNKFEDFDYITNFSHDGRLYIVYFYDRIAFDNNQKKRFILAANKLCFKERGKNGIKISGDELRLKIHTQARLVGFKESKNEDTYMFFTKKQSHDEYKRHK